MSEYKKPVNQAEFDLNFSQKKPLMNKSEAYFESSRCLFCYDAPCIKACPTGIDIPLFIKQIQSGNLVGSARTIFESNWLGNACGKICPTGILCEGACVYNEQNVIPVQIGRLQNFATNNAIRNQHKLFKVGKTNGLKVALIGSGPASISCASELRIMGYEIDIYEAKSRPSGLTLHGIAAYKITNAEVIEELEYLTDQLGLNFICDYGIQSKAQLEELERNYDAIFLGVGIGSTATLGIEGEQFENVIGAVEFIERLRKDQFKVDLPNKIIIIGGGNTAMDAASQSARLGGEDVTLVYRRDKISMGAYEFEYKLAVSAGVKSVFSSQPIAIKGEERATGVEFIRTKSNLGKLETIKGSEFTLEADLIIKATGQAKQTKFLSMIDELQLDNRNRIVVDADTFQCTNKMYFAGGDAVNGGAEVVNAVYEGKKAAQGIHQWLNTKK